jgi:hypothetical protein
LFFSRKLLVFRGRCCPAAGFPQLSGRQEHAQGFGSVSYIKDSLLLLVLSFAAGLGLHLCKLLLPVSALGENSLVDLVCAICSSRQGSCSLVSSDFASCELKGGSQSYFSCSYFSFLSQGSGFGTADSFRYCS